MFVLWLCWRVHFKSWLFFVELCFLAGPLRTWRICDPNRSTRCVSLVCWEVGDTHSSTTSLASPPVRGLDGIPGVCFVERRRGVSTHQ